MRLGARLLLGPVQVVPGKPQVPLVLLPLLTLSVTGSPTTPFCLPAHLPHLRPEAVECRGWLGRTAQFGLLDPIQEGLHSLSTRPPRPSLRIVPTKKKNGKSFSAFFAFQGILRKSFSVFFSNFAHIREKSGNQNGKMLSANTPM